MTNYEYTLDFSAGIPDNWTVLPSHSYTCFESPYFSVTGDSAVVGIPSELMSLVSCSLHLLDGTAVTNRQISFNQKSGIVSWPISNLHGLSLYITIFYKGTIKSFVNCDISIQINGHVNTTLIQSEITPRLLQSKLAAIIPDALLERYRFISQNETQFKKTFPDSDITSLILKYENAQQLLREGNTESFPIIDASLNSLLSIKQDLLSASLAVANLDILYTTGPLPESQTNLKRLTITNGESVTKTLYTVPSGTIQGIEKNFNSSRVLLTIQNDTDTSSHIYEYNLHTKAITQLTSKPNCIDIDPAYLPDGSIVFSSNRDMRYSRYSTTSNNHLMSLYRMEYDGANIHRIGGIRSETDTSVLSDGRIQYIQDDKNGISRLFTCSPDGTNPALFWNSSAVSYSISDAHELASPGKILCLVSQPGTLFDQSVVTIDRSNGMDNAVSIVMSNTVYSLADILDTVHSTTAYPAFYDNLNPIDDIHYICTRSSVIETESGIWLIDRFGNEMPLSIDSKYCDNALPLVNSSAPPVIPARSNVTDNEGRLYVLNAYDGTHMQPVPKQAINQLRVIEHIPNYTGSNHSPVAIGICDNRIQRIVGTYPVEKDGSVFFTVPANSEISFQLLDSSGMMIQSMSSTTMVQPGETTGCIGCHDNRSSAPPVTISKVPIALLKSEPTSREPLPVTDTISFMSDIQPLFNQSCISCHSYGGSAESILNLSADKTPVFNIAYLDIWQKNMTGWNSIYETNSIVSPYEVGSHASKLIQVIQSDHQGVQLSDHNITLLTTWIDMGAPYYSDYLSAYPDNLYGRSPLTNVQLSTLAEYAEITPDILSEPIVNPLYVINLDNPELSPYLHALDSGSDTYSQAVTLINNGAQVLIERPRSDMPGFIPCDADQQAIEKAMLAKESELLNRSAISDGISRYDTTK